MKTNKIFEYIIFWQPDQEEAKKGVKAEMITPIKTVLATDIEKANILASREIPEKYLDQLDQVTIAVRPF